MRQVRIGFLGCGGIAKAHLSILEKMPEALPVAFCDVLKERAVEQAVRFSGRAYSEYEEMLEKEELDALYVCLPPFAHRNQEILAAQKGLHLFIEKPVALSTEAALRIQQVIQKAGVIASVAYMLRYLAATVRMKQTLANRRTTLALGWYLGGLPSPPWWGKMEGSGGQFVEQTTHLVDLLSHLLGEVESVSANFGREIFRNLEGVDIPDTGVVNMRFRNGAVGAVLNSCGLAVSAPPPGIWLGGEDFFVEFNYNALKIATSQASEEEKVDLGAAFEEENRAFLRAVLQGERKAILCPYAEGVKTLAVTLAANRSAAEGRPVKVEEMLPGFPT